MYERVTYLAEKEGLTVSELLFQALEYRLDASHGYYDVPDILVQRINQVIDQEQVMMQDVRSMASSVNANLSELVSLANGHDYLFTETE